MLKWFSENGFYWNSEISVIAAQNGQLGVLKWMVKNGYAIERESCMMVAQKCKKYRVSDWLEKSIAK